MRVCILSQQAGTAWSGVGTYCRVLAHELSKLGQDVTVMAPGGGAIPGVRVLCLGPPLRGGSHAVWLAAALRYARTAHTRCCFDIVHFADGRESLFCPRDRVPHVGTVHDYYFAFGWREGLSIRRYYNDWLRRYVYQRGVHVLERTGLRKHDLLLFNSENVRAKVADAYGLDSRKLRVVHLAVPPRRRSLEPREGGRPILLFAGGNFQRKGVGTILRALPLLSQRWRDIQLRVLGNDHSARQMAGLATKLRVARRVSFLGWRPWHEVMREMERASLFVMPSWEEGFGLVFLEAMQVGTPVIGGDAGGTREVITDGINGFLVPPGDHHALADRIARVLESTEVRESLVEGGKATVQRFTPQDLAEATLGAYREALDHGISGNTETEASVRQMLDTAAGAS